MTVIILKYLFISVYPFLLTLHTN